MATQLRWSTKDYAVVNLNLDEKNPRLGRETTARAPREIIQYLFDHDKAYLVAESIAIRGFFPNEPLLSIKEKGKMIVVEGNRRLAALKALKEPGLLEGPFQKKVERLSKRMDLDSISKVPITIAPNRKATDVQIAGRHVGTPVLPWEAENRASFILDKLAEGYSNEELADDLGFSLSDIQQARQTRAIADMARSLDLPEEVKAKLENPRTQVFTTIERVIGSSVGRRFFMVEPNPDHGLVGNTTKPEFIKGFKKFVIDVALSKESSRSLNKLEDQEAYFKKWKPEDIPVKKKGSFVPSDIITGKSVASVPPSEKTITTVKAPLGSKTVIPRDFKVRYGSDRLKDIRTELTKLRRADYPNAGAVLLRVFFELTITDYLVRSGDYAIITKKLKDKGAQLPYGKPTLKQLLHEIPGIVKGKLSEAECNRVFKAIKYDPHAPFSITELHGFVHSTDFPSERDIYQFWTRTEPLFRMMLENDVEPMPTK